MIWLNEIEDQNPDIIDKKEVLYCDIKMSLDNVGLITNKIINKYIYICHIIPLLIYLYFAIKR